MSSSYLQLVPDVESPYRYYTHHSNNSVGREDMSVQIWHVSMIT